MSTTTTITLPSEARWSRRMIAIATAVLVALVVTVSLVVSTLGHSSSSAPTLRTPQSASVSADCRAPIPGHLSPC